MINHILKSWKSTSPYRSSRLNLCPACFTAGRCCFLLPNLRSTFERNESEFLRLDNLVWIDSCEISKVHVQLALKTHFQWFKLYFCRFCFEKRARRSSSWYRTVKHALSVRASSILRLVPFASEFVFFVWSCSCSSSFSLHSIKTSARACTL